MTAILVKKGFKVNIEKGAGEGAKFRNEDYLAAGGNIVDGNKAWDTGKETFPPKIRHVTNDFPRRYSLESPSADGE